VHGIGDRRARRARAQRRDEGNTYTGASFVPDWTGDGAYEGAIVLPGVHVASDVHGAEYIFDSDGRY
jgi:hypothetical protein